MKFKRIKLTNFMRYKGENELVFSCDPEKNVTVILGDNTFGKTTIAQAFRWGLYGEVINTNYDSKDSLTLLNKEVISSMDANSRNYVEVLIEVTDDEYTYEFIRKAEFTRRYPSMIADQKSHKLLMRSKRDDSAWSDYIDDMGTGPKDRNMVTDQINKLFPKELSAYFLFDGERWSDDKASKKDIKNSINTIMGISALSSMKYHLEQYGANGASSVLRTIKKRTVGSDGEAEKLTKQQELYDAKIEEFKKQIESSKEAVETYRELVHKSEDILNSNRKVEDEQKEAKRLENAIDRADKELDSTMRSFIKDYSANLYKILLAPLEAEVKMVLSSVDFDKKGIPNVNDKTIHYLLENGECLCGCNLKENKDAYDTLVKLLDVVPPKVIGSEVGFFQNKLREWAADAEDKKNYLTDKANHYEEEKYQKDDFEDELYHINKRIDGKINFQQERIKMNGNRQKLEQNNEAIRRNEQNIEDYKRKIEAIDAQLEKIAQADATTAKFRRMYAYAEALAKTTKEILRDNEEPLKNALNDKIKENFSKMFSEKEKYAELGDDYKLHLYYRKMTSDAGVITVEETQLSEGERIATNFVFIVSILELAHERSKKEDKDVVITLPLVLDAPFSKLSSDNTGLIASVLPDAADQVILFMLDKDWAASGLEDHTDRTFRYRVKKEVDGNSSMIVKE